MKRIEKWLTFCFIALLLAVGVGGEAPRALTELSVTVKSYTYGSERSEPKVKGNVSGGEERFYVRALTDSVTDKWNEIDERPVSLGMPTEGGRYELMVTVGANADYGGGSAVCEFYVYPTELDITLSVKESVYFGDGVGEGDLFDIGYLLGREYTVEYAERGSESFSDKPPVRVGKYTLRVSAMASNNCKATEKRGDFEIKKRPVQAELMMSEQRITPDSLNEFSPFPEYVGDSDAVREALRESVVSVSYRPWGSDAPFSTARPTAVGEYEMRIYCPEGEDLLSFELTARLIVMRSTIAPTVTVKGWTYGERPSSPILSEGSNPGGGKVTYYYKLSDGGEYSLNVPTEAGRYTLKAVIDPSEGYEGGECYTEFTVEKAELRVSVFMDDWVYGGERSALGISGNDGDGECLITYYAMDDGDWSPMSEGSYPTAAGSYRVRCLVLEGKNYKSCEAWADFTVKKAAPSLSVEMDGFAFFAKAPTPKVNGNVEKGKERFVYYPKGGDAEYGSESLASVVLRPGEYTVRVIVSETDNYLSGSAEANFTVTKADLPVSSMRLSVRSGGVEVERVEYGKDYELVLLNNVGYGRVSYFFEKKGEGYVGERPEAVGQYKVRVEVAATDIYRALTLYFDFEIVRTSRGELSLTYADRVYGDEPEPPLLSGRTDELSHIHKSYYFKPYGGDDSLYTPSVPKKAGRYTVKLVISPTESYEGTEIISHFTIKKAPTLITVIDQTAVYSGEAAGLKVELNHGESEPIFSGERAIDVGVYKIKVSVPESENYLAAEEEVELTVVRAQGSISASMDDRPWNGGRVTGPSYSAVGDGEVTVEYYKDGQRLDGAPTEVGEYTVRLILADGKNYKGCSTELSFRITEAVMIDDEENNGLWIYLSLLLFVLLIIAVVIALILTSKRRGKEDTGRLLPGGGPLPFPTDKGAKAEDNSGSDSEYRLPTETVDADEGEPIKEEKRNERGMIALEMWTETDPAPKPDPTVRAEVVYKKGGRCAEINLDTLCRHFADGETVDMNSLLEKGLISKKCKRVKLLGRGELTKTLDIRLDSYSKRAGESVKSGK